VTRYDRITYGTAALFAGLSIMIASTILRPSGTGSTDMGTSPAPAIALPGLPDVGGENSSAYSSVTERPIFVASRKPPTGSTSSVDSSFSLVGILLTDGKKLAAIRRTSDHEETTLSVGQSIDGWTIVDIKNGAVFLQSAESRQVLRLADDKNSGVKNK
jgi:hypothetical protein